MMLMPEQLLGKRERAQPPVGWLGGLPGAGFWKTMAVC
jgi:hypothetical protein